MLATVACEVLERARDRRDLERPLRGVELRFRRVGEEVDRDVLLPGEQIAGPQLGAEAPLHEECIAPQARLRGL